MTSEELAGILQSRGQEEGVSYYVISEKRYTVPQYVLDFVNKMKTPIQNGEEVGFTRATDELGRERLTKIWRQKKEGTTKTAEPAKQAPPQRHHVKVIKVNEVALKYDNLSKDPRIAGQRLIMMTPAMFGIFTNAGIKEEDEIDILIDAQGIVSLPTDFKGATGFTPAHEILKDNINRLEEEAKAKAKANTPATAPVAATVAPQGKPIVNPVQTPGKEETEKPDTARPTPSPLPAPEKATLTILHTVNLGNYESLKIGIEGQAEDREELELFLDDTLSRYGRNHPATMDAIDTYRRRILGVQV